MKTDGAPDAVTDRRCGIARRPKLKAWRGAAPGASDIAPDQAPMNEHDAADNKSTAGAAKTHESTTNHSGRDGSTGLQRVRENRADLEDLADSDLPCAWVADALLDAVDADDGNGGDADR